MRIKSPLRRGVVNVWVIFTLFMMVGLVGLACDAGWSVLVLHQLQSAADSAALAGAAKVASDQTAARLAAHDLAIANKAANTTVKLDLNAGNTVGGDIVIGRFDRNSHVFTATTTSPNAVKVLANRTDSGIDGKVPLVFGRAFGANTVALSRTAIAIASSTTGAAVLVLDPNSSCALQLQGSPTMNVTGGSIQVNSGSNTAACEGGSPSLSAPILNVVGGSTASNQGGPVHTNQPVVPDPLATLPAPPPGTTFADPGKNGAKTVNPGNYPSGFDRNGGILTMNPGIYTLGGTGFKLNGAAGVVGHQVMIYLKSGSINFIGTGALTLDPPTSGTYAGIAIFQARDNHNGGQINGSNSTNILGTIYIPNANLDIRGNGGGTIGTQLIAWTMTFGGNGSINVPYNGAFANIPGKVFLVQ